MWNTEWVCNKAAVQLLEVYNFTIFGQERNYKGL